MNNDQILFAIWVKEICKLSALIKFLIFSTASNMATLITYNFLSTLLYMEEKCYILIMIWFQKLKVVTSFRALEFTQCFQGICSPLLAPSSHLCPHLLRGFSSH